MPTKNNWTEIHLKITNFILLTTKTLGKSKNASNVHKNFPQLWEKWSTTSVKIVLLLGTFLWIQENWWPLWSTERSSLTVSWRVGMSMDLLHKPAPCLSCTDHFAWRRLNLALCFNKILIIQKCYLLQFSLQCLPLLEVSWYFSARFSPLSFTTPLEPSFSLRTGVIFIWEPGKDTEQV